MSSRKDSGTSLNLRVRRRVCCSYLTTAIMADGRSLVHAALSVGSDFHRPCRGNGTFPGRGVSPSCSTWKFRKPCQELLKIWSRCGGRALTVSAKAGPGGASRQPLGSVSADHSGAGAKGQRNLFLMAADGGAKKGTVRVLCQCQHIHAEILMLQIARTLRLREECVS